MATTFTASGVILDSPEAKVFQIDVPENDAVDTATALTFAAGGMVPLNAVPQEVYMVEVTPAASNTTVAGLISIPASSLTTLGFSTLKTSAASAQAVAHTYQVYIHTRRFYQ